MPTYEYQCTACSHRFARSESIAQHDRERPPRPRRPPRGPACPKCGSRDVERVFSPFFAKTVRKS